MTGWKKSSYCNGSDMCVEVADRAGQVRVRDSGNPDGGELEFTPATWAAFLARVKAGELTG